MLVSAAAAELGCNNQRVYALVNKGALDHKVENRHVYVSEESVRVRQRLLALPNHLLTLAETSEALGVTRRTITNWVQAGKLSPVSTETRRTLFDPLDVARVAAARSGPRTGRVGPRTGRVGDP
jgi:DNA-binding transcriptional MerR regulator